TCFLFLRNRGLHPDTGVRREGLDFLFLRIHRTGADGRLHSLLLDNRLRADNHLLLGRGRGGRGGLPFHERAGDAVRVALPRRPLRFLQSRRLAGRPCFTQLQGIGGLPLARRVALPQQGGGHILVIGNGRGTEVDGRIPVGGGRLLAENHIRVGTG